MPFQYSELMFLYLVVSRSETGTLMLMRQIVVLCRKYCKQRFPYSKTITDRRLFHDWTWLLSFFIPEHLICLGSRVKFFRHKMSSKYELKNLATNHEMQPFLRFCLTSTPSHQKRVLNKNVNELYGRSILDLPRNGHKQRLGCLGDSFINIFLLFETDKESFSFRITACK